MTGIKGRVAFITGGGRGIGRSIAEDLRDSGAMVAVGDLRLPEIPDVLGVELDVTSLQSVDEAFSCVESALGSVEILVINAGIFVVEPLAETNFETWQRILEVNLTGAFLCAQRALSRMQSANYGRIVTIGSSAGKTPGRNPSAAYGASKAGMMMLAKAIAKEYAPFGITSNVIAPSYIKTEMINGLSDISGVIPVGRMGTPEEVASLTTYLCSDEAAFITGEVVDLNGGNFID